MVASLDVQDKILAELSKYKRAEALFGQPLAIRQRDKICPVFIKYNRALKRRYNLRDIVDPISLRDIDDSNEWLIGRLDDDFEEEGELVFDDDTLTWGDVSRAVGAKEPTFYSRARASGATNVSCSSSSTTQPTPKQINLDDSDQEEEDIDGYKSNEGVNEDEHQFSDDEFDL
ncbi:uncharacterized protein E6C27_scaffold43053G00260 [Cucumis melo var. makuwa]|uniref:Uncharacterized protein n=1 Tax=Cucumis melo var. makuwa TaxID=1194695 RepID=A0A5A7SRA2_CUCMM|nr:uncharacterized protein E6C27_scaffold43053G00260 [Cucumis melo var. makuwa]